jgi:hypothetical protein
MARPTAPIQLGSCATALDTPAPTTNTTWPASASCRIASANGDRAGSAGKLSVSNYATWLEGFRLYQNRPDEMPAIIDSRSRRG